VRNMLPLRGSRNPIKEKQAGHTPNTNPRVLPPNPALAFGLQSIHLFFEKIYNVINIPNNIENAMYGIELRGFCTISVNQISNANDVEML